MVGDYITLYESIFSGKGLSVTPFPWQGCGARIPVSPGDVGILQSPNYPDVFLSGVNCTWHLEASEGEAVDALLNYFYQELAIFSCAAFHFPIFSFAAFQFPIFSFAAF